MTTDSFARELIDLERRGWEALSSDSGSAYYESHLTADAVMGFPFGLMNRQEALSGIDEAEPWSSFRIDNPQVIQLGPDSGIVAYSVVAQREGQEPFSAVVSSTFVRQGGDWKLAFHQQSFA